MSRNINITVRLSEYEAIGLAELSDKYNLTATELLRDCTLSNFEERQVTYTYNDLWDFTVQTKNTGEYIRGIISVVKQDELFLHELSKIRMLESDIRALKMETYNDIQKTRKRVRDYLCKKIRDNKETFYDKVLVNKNDPKTKQIQVKVTEEQHKLLKEMAKKENTSMSVLLKDNVFKRCVDDRIIVKTYSMDELNKAIEESNNMLNTILENIKTRKVKEIDMKNILIYLEKIKTLISDFNKTILMEQKDIRREVNKLMKERRDKHGYFKGNSNKK